MKVKLISYSQVPISEDFKTIGELICYSARVSNPASQANTLTNDKLLNYLIKHKHWSPFEMVSACIEVDSTRDIVRQILRHRSFSFQEFSQRYANPTESLGFELREARLQDTKNRQNSVEVDDKALKEGWVIQQKRVKNAALVAYQWAIDHGIALEQARVVLPEGMTKSRCYISGSLRSWIHYCDARDGNGTQKEHMEIAQAIRPIIDQLLGLDS